MAHRRAANAATLEADLNTVFIDNEGGEILAGFEIAESDGFAPSAVLEREGLHGDGERALGRADLDHVALLHQRTTGDVAPRDGAAGVDAARENEALVAHGGRKRI